MAKKNYLEKAIKLIGKWIIEDKNYEIDEAKLCDAINPLLNFKIIQIDIKENVIEQILTKTEKIVDGEFLYDYAKKRKPVIISEYKNDDIKDSYEKLKFVCTEVVNMIHEEYESSSFSKPRLNKNGEQILTQQGRIEWDKLFRYVKYNVMNYYPSDDNSLNLTPNMIFKLKELSSGRILGNKHLSQKTNYSYDVILNTFKLCSEKISSSVRLKTFNSENQKFNYICAIVRNNLNDVYMKMKSNNKNKEKFEKMDVSQLYYNGASFSSKSDECPEDLKTLW